MLEAIKCIWRRARGDKAIKSKSRKAGGPKEVSTDTGRDIKGLFEEMLEKARGLDIALKSPPILLRWSTLLLASSKSRPPRR